MNSQNPFGGILTRRVILGAVLIAVILLGLMAVFLWASMPDSVTLAPSTAVLTVVPAPEATATPAPATPSPSATAEPSVEVPPPPPSGTISLNALVQITGTGGDGLRMRSEPGLQSTVLFIGDESEVFQVADGPQDLDGYTWWYLVAPYDESRRGWVVSNYLAIVQNP